MYRALKYLHVLGFALFFGSILSHVVEGRASSSMIDRSVSLYARDTVQLASYTLTIPGLALATITGVVMVLSRRGLLAQNWMRVHFALGVAISAFSFVIVRAGATLKAALDAARPMDSQLLTSASLVERYVGLTNILLTLLTVATALIFARSK